MRLRTRTSVATLFLAVLVFLFYITESDPPLSAAEKALEEWDLQKAQEQLTNLAARFPNDSTVLSLLARTLMLSGEFQKALPMYTTVLAGDSPAEHPQSLEFAYVLHMLGEQDSASTLTRRILSHSMAVKAWDRVAVSANILGLISFVRGEYRSALDWQTRSLESARRANSAILRAHALRQLGVLSWYNGSLDTALGFYRAALDLYRAQNHRQGEATTLSNIGHLHSEKGERFIGLRYQLDAFSIRKEIGDQQGLADSYYFLSSMPFSVGRRTMPYAYRLKSLQLSAAIGYAWGREVASRALNELRDANLVPESMANSFYDSLLSRSLEGKVHLLWRKVDHERSSRQWQHATETLRSIITLCASSGYEFSGRVAERYLSQTLAEAGRFGEAERVARSLLKKLPPAHEEERLYALIALGSSLIGKGDIVQARQIFRPVTKDLDLMYLRELRRGTAGFERAVITVKEYRTKAYEALASSYELRAVEEIFRVIEEDRQLPFWMMSTAQSAESREAIGRFVQLLSEFDSNHKHVDNLNEAKLVMGEIEQLMLADQRADAAFPGNAVVEKTVSVSELMSLLTPHELFVEYFVTTRKIFLFAARHERSILLELPLGEGEVFTLSEVMNATLLRGRKNPGDDAWKAPAQFLYEELMRPLFVRQFLREGDHVIIAPHRSLFSIPFHTLLQPKEKTKSSPLLETCGISYVPSGSWLASQRRQSPTPMNTLLTLAPSVHSLPFTRKEVKEATGSAWTASRTLVGSEARASRVKQEAGDFDILHVASHARNYPEHPLYSTVELFDRGMRLHEFFHMRAPKRLVVLSACETGSGTGLVSQDLSSEEIVSFPRALLQAGVPSVVSTSWLVEDEATALLLVEFYKLLGKRGENGLKLDEILSQAQRNFIENARISKKFDHPFYWAAFFLTGDNR